MRSHTWNYLLFKALEKSVFVFNISKSRKVTEEGYIDEEGKQKISFTGSAAQEFAKKLCR